VSVTRLVPVERRGQGAVDGHLPIALLHYNPRPACHRSTTRAPVALPSRRQETHALQPLENLLF
jgi:hypothetical protein